MSQFLAVVSQGVSNDEVEPMLCITLRRPFVHTLYIACLYYPMVRLSRTSSCSKTSHHSSWVLLSAQDCGLVCLLSFFQSIALKILLSPSRLSAGRPNKKSLQVINTQIRRSMGANVYCVLFRQGDKGHLKTLNPSHSQNTSYKRTYRFKETRIHV